MWPLGLMLFASGCKTTANGPMEASARPPTVVIPAGTPAAPFTGNDPFELNLWGSAPPWFEAQESETFRNWQAAKSGPDAQRLVDPILGDTSLARVEFDFAVINTNLGQIVRTSQGVLGLVPKGLRVIGKLTSGRVLVEDASNSPHVAATAHDLVANKTSPFPDVTRVFDATGLCLVALKDGRLVRSIDEGKTYKTLPIRETIDRAFVRPDGLSVVATSGQDPATTFRAVTTSDKVSKLNVTAKTLLRWHGWIMEPPALTVDNELSVGRVLTRSGKKLEDIPFPALAKGIAFLPMGFHLRNPQSPELAGRWISALEVPPESPKPPPRLRMSATENSLVSGISLGALSGGPAGILKMLSTGQNIAVPECKGLWCIRHTAEVAWTTTPVHSSGSPPTSTVPASPTNSASREAGSDLIGRFFQDAVCATTTNKGICEPGPPAIPPTIALFQRKTNQIKFVRAPSGCSPKSLTSLRGLVVLHCDEKRYVADEAGDFVLEGTVSKPVIEKGGALPSYRSTSVQYKIAEDGTIAMCRGPQGNYWSVDVRDPVPVGGVTNFRTADIEKMVLCEALPGGVALVGIASSLGDALTLQLFTKEGLKTPVPTIKIPGQVRDIFIKNGRVFIEFREPIEVPAPAEKTRRVIVTQSGGFLPALE